MRLHRGFVVESSGHLEATIRESVVRVVWKAEAWAATEYGDVVRIRKSGIVEDDNLNVARDEAERLLDGAKSHLETAVRVALDTADIRK